MEMTKELEVFRSAPVPKAVLKNAVPAMVAMLMVLKASIGANGLAWAQPVADLLSTILVVILYIITVRKMEVKHHTT